MLAVARRSELRRAARHVAAADPRMAEVIALVGPCTLEQRRGRYGALVRAIVGQQVSTAAARSIHARLVAACGGAVSPRAVSRLSTAELRAVGLSARKAGYVADLTARVAGGALRLDRLHAEDDETVIAELCQVHGIGRWTAEMFLMFVLLRPDVLPVGDLGIRNGFRKVYGMKSPPTPERMQRLAEPWRPWRSVASWYLWRALDGEAKLP